MRFIIVLVGAATFVLAGCSPNGGWNAAGDVITGIGVYKANDAKLISLFRAEDQVLRRISGDRYSCGNPSDPATKFVLGKKKAAEAIAESDFNFTSERWTTSIKVILAYVAAMKGFEADHAKRVEALNNLENETQAFAGILKSTPFAGVVSVFKATQGLLADLDTVGTDKQKQIVAVQMKKDLKIAVDYLTKQEILNQLTGPEKDHFKLWDQCARETVNYFIALGDPNFYDQYGPPTLKTHPNARLSGASGYEVYTLNLKYEIDQAALDVKIDLATPLKKIVAQNDALIAGSLLDLNGLNVWGRDACTAWTALAKADNSKSSCDIPMVFAASDSAAAGAAKPATP